MKSWKWFQRLAVVMAMAQSAWAAGVEVGGYTNDFSTQPTAADWATASMAGAGGDITNAAALDTAVGTLTAASITNRAVSDPNNPPAVSPNALWSSTGKYLQTRPSGNKFTALMATLVNNTSVDLHSFAVGYNFTEAGVLNEEINGYRVYFSLTGAANSWTNIAGLSSVAPGMLATNLNVTWHSNTPLYLLWADDNGSPADTANQIDNFFVNPSIPPSFASQPQDALVCPGSPAVFTVGAVGSLPLNYQWRKITTTSTNTIAGATNATHSIASVGADDLASYSVVVTNIFGSVTSTVATLTVSTNPVVIAAQPQSSTNLYGTQASFQVDIDRASAGPLHFQWYRVTTNGYEVLSGQTLPTLTLGVYETNVANYFAVVSNCVNAVTSQLASLSLFYAPVAIIGQPQNLQAAPGSTASFTVDATGVLLSYQWYKNNTAIPGATNATLTLTNVQDTDFGYYQALVSNPAGSQSSWRAVLLVLIPSYDIVPLTNQVWRYNQGGTNLGTAWKEVSYDASSWPTGRGVFAYETNNAVVQAFTNTVLSLKNPSSNSIITYYFRTTFNLTNDLTRLSLTFSNLIDDGCVVYLNGVEAYRLRITSDVTVTYDTLAANAAEGVFDVTNLPAKLLGPGTNVLAVEVHQTSATGVDAVFGLSATVQPLIPTFAPQITNQPQDLVVLEPRPAIFTVGYVGEGATLQWYKLTTSGEQLIPGANETSLTLSNPIQGVDDQNLYYVVISNVLSGISGPTISRKAVLTLLPDTNPPVLLQADGTADPFTVILSFDEAVFVDTSETVFSLTNTFGETLTINSVVLANGTNVILTSLAPRLPDRNYIVTVSNVRDLARSSNVAAPLAAPVAFLLPIINWVDSYEFSQPISGIDPVEDFTNGAWLRPDYDPFGSGGSWFYPGFSTFHLGLVALPVPTGDELSLAALAAYFRKPFQLPAAPSPSGLEFRLRHLVGDGAVFYLNGAELLRYNMPVGTVWPVSYASTAIADPVLRGPTTIPIPNLQTGINLLAVEIHGSQTNDQTLAFGMELTARIESLVTGAVLVTTAPANVTIVQGQAANWGFRSVGGRAFQWLTNDAAVPGGTNLAFGMTNVPLSADGTLVSIAVTGASGSVTSAPARLTVLPDTSPPRLVSAVISASNTITVAFSEEVTEATATNVLNYAITNTMGGALTITDISLTNGTNAVIHVSFLPVGIFIVVVNNVTDSFALHNTILRNSRVTVAVQNYPLITIDAATQWKYSYTNETDLGTAWRGPGYNDSSWPVGAGLFDGKKGGRVAADLPEPVRTVLLVTNKTVNAIPTYYFRTGFVLPLFYGQGATLGIRPVLDDGAAFYLNGQLVYSTGVTIPTTYAAYATRSIGNAAYEEPFNASAASLVPGVNTLAVEVKNYNATSSDITFGTCLYLNVPSVVLPADWSGPQPPADPPRLFVAPEGASDIRLWWTPNTIATLQFADEFNATNTLWTTFTNAGNPCFLPATNVARFYRLKQ